MTTKAPARGRMILAADFAADLMSRNPISISADATVHDAVAMMTDRGFSIAPVIDEAGRPVGVISRSDLLVHLRERGDHAYLAEEVAADMSRGVGARPGFSVEIVDPTQVRDVMTPVVFTVTLDTPAPRVVEQMLNLKVHHLFVVDEDRALVGVISSLDVLRYLKVE